MLQINLTIVDDPSNHLVYKGAGHWAATRAEAALRLLEQALPNLRFDSRRDDRYARLRASASLPGQVQAEGFIEALTRALAATGTCLEDGVLGRPA